MDKTNRHVANQIVAVAVENLMRPDMQNDVKISGRPAANAALPVAGRAQARAGVHARGNFNCDFGSALAPSGAPARATGLFHGAAGAFASRAGLGDAENPARVDDLPASAAGGTGLRCRARLRARTAAGLAGVWFGDRDFLFAAQYRFLKRDLHVVTKVGAALRAGGIAPFAAEEFVEDAAGAASKHFPENFKRIMKPAATKPSGAPCAGIESGMTVLVVRGPFLRIAQRFVGFPQFFEFFLGGFVAGILIRMVFDGQFAIGLFD